MTTEGQRKGAEANRAAAMVRDEGVLARIESGWTYAEVADWLGIAVDSVRTVVYRARQRAGIRVRPYVKGE